MSYMIRCPISLASVVRIDVDEKCPTRPQDVQEAHPRSPDIVGELRVPALIAMLDGVLE
jgi:hypothetical protein